MGVDSRSGADIAFDAGPDCLFFGRSVVHFDDRTFGSLGELASGARIGLFWYGERKICAQFFATY